VFVCQSSDSNLSVGNLEDIEVDFGLVRCSSFSLPGPFSSLPLVILFAVAGFFWFPSLFEGALVHINTDGGHAAQCVVSAPASHQEDGGAAKRRVCFARNKQQPPDK
jgi:hypothetical protein